MKRLMTWGLGLALAFGVSGGIRAAEKDAAIGGYCPVAYVKMGKAVKGDARWSSEREGQKFPFSAPQAKEMFDKSPTSTASRTMVTAPPASRWARRSSRTPKRSASTKG